jgi:hypothetical protein
MKDIGVDGTTKVTWIFKKYTTKLHKISRSKFVTVQAARSYRALASKLFGAKGHTRYRRQVRGSHMGKQQNAVHLTALITA